MFNAPRPNPEDLPTPAQLRRSTVLAALGAVAIAVCVVMPAEYGDDPTGVGALLGLTEMGEIKSQLAREAEEDHASLWRRGLQGAAALLVGSAQAQEAWRDEFSFTLQPGESAEWKLMMTEGQTAQYLMTVEGGRVNFDLHGHGGGQSETYERGRGSTGSEGAILAPFDGEHGWFWHNRDSQPVTVTVQLRGEYAELKQMD